MMKAIAVLTVLLGYNMAVKVCSIMKMCGFKVEEMSEEELIEAYNKLMEDKRFQKYMR